MSLLVKGVQYYEMEVFPFEIGLAMQYSNANTSADPTIQRQQGYSDFNDYEPHNDLHGPQPYNEHAKYPQSAGGGGMGIALPDSNVGLGIMNTGMSTGTGMDMGMCMNMDMNLHTSANMNMTPGTHPPYRELCGTAPFHVQSYFTPSHAVMTNDIQPLLPMGGKAGTDSVISVGATSAPSTHPIPIPVPNHHFRSGAQLALAPAFYSSSYEYPSTPYYHSTSPATSASSMSAHSDDFDHRAFNSVNVPQATAKSPSPGSPGPTPSPAASAGSKSAADSPNLPVQLVQQRKSTASFECPKCGKFFTRGADVKRHETSVHFPRPVDCPVENCVRKGSIGFPRRDHLMEHLRTFHHQDIPKRCGNKRRKAST